MPVNTWKVLELENQAQPAILVRYHFNEDGYNIDISDFSRVWTQSLDKNQIIQRASESATSIDPGEDAEQFRILLTKIAEALDRKDGTTLTIHGSEDGRSLSLHITTPLPRPLSPFEWDLHLHSLPVQQIERLVVTPLLLHTSKLKSQIESLIAELHDKDRVISKITDRLETSGNDLTTVFPGVSNIKTNRRKPQRDQLARHVKGLSDFDEQAWRERISENGFHDRLTTEQINEVFGNLDAIQQAITVDTKNGPWWNKFQIEKRISPSPKKLPASKTYNSQSRSSERDSKANEESDYEDFQRQRTPPKLKSPHSQAQTENLEGQPSVQHEDESTTDEEEEHDLDAQPMASSPTQTGSTHTSRTLLVVDPHPPSKSQGLSEPIPATKSTRKLGLVGGKKEEKQSRDQSKSQQHKPPSKLGMIGGKAYTNSVRQTTPPDRRPRELNGGKGLPNEIFKPSPITKTASELREDPLELSEHAHEADPDHPEKEKVADPEQTSQERADLKRDVLKRELEQKAKAPTKKRRKF